MANYILTLALTFLWTCKTCKGWLHSIGGEGDYTLVGTVSDKFANIYIAGRYHSEVSPTTVQMGDKSITLPIPRKSDSFIVKFSSSGRPIWSTVFTGTENDIIHDIATDTNGHVYIALNTNSTDAQLILPVNVSMSFPSTFTHIIKLHSNGSHLWTARITRGPRNSMTRLVTSFNALYVFGTMSTYENSIEFQSASTSDTRLTYPLIDVRVPYLAKYSTSGILQWLAPVSSNGTVWSQTINVDPSGNVYITGRILFPATFVTFMSSETSHGSTRDLNISASPPRNNVFSFITKYDASGYPIWTFHLGPTAATINSLQIHNNSILIGGSFYEITFRSWNSSTQSVLNWLGSESAFFASYTLNGVFEYARRIDGPLPINSSEILQRPNGGNASDWIWTIESFTMKNDSVNVVCGDFYAAALFFDFSNETSVKQKGKGSGFCGVFSSSGNVLSAMNMYSINGAASIRYSTKDADGNVVLVGQFSGSELIFERDGYQLDQVIQNQGLSSIFVWRLSNSFFEHPKALLETSTSLDTSSSYSSSNVKTSTISSALPSGFKHTSTCPVSTPSPLSPDLPSNSPSSLSTASTLPWHYTLLGVGSTLFLVAIGSVVTAFTLRRKRKSNRHFNRNVSKSSEEYFRSSSMALADMTGLSPLKNVNPMNTSGNNKNTLLSWKMEPIE